MANFKMYTLVLNRIKCVLIDILTRKLEMTAFTVDTVVSGYNTK